MRWRGWLSAVIICSCAAVRPAPAADAARPSAILIEVSSGQSLREENADAGMPPGSLNQLMVVLLSLEEAGMGALPLDAAVTVDAPVAESMTVPPIHWPAKAKSAPTPVA